ncbi:MAG: DUF3179 domain-containing protein [Chloroflexota bacterium]|nr:DUF3179 domain-containing protein [Chloroflexota bacterium]
MKNKQRISVFIAIGGIGLLLLAACSAPGLLQAPVGREAAIGEQEGIAEPGAVDSPEARSTTPENENEDLQIGEEAGISTVDDRSSQLRASTSSWNTDWTRHSISYDELLSGGPPRDGIPSIDNPTFVGPDEAAGWLASNEPVIALEVGDRARAYPLQILTWHEIANDELGGVPVAITFCPLCNSAITFDRRLEGEVLEFGTSGLLRNSDLVMYDRTTESLWQQFTGEGIVGELTGKQLTFLPSSLVSFADFREAYPDGEVLSRDTGFRRAYGNNPYVGYDDVNSSPFLYRGVIDGRLTPMERVVTLSLGSSLDSEEAIDVAYPLSILAETGVINDRQSGQDLAVFHADGTASALGAQVIANADDVGATGVFDRNLDGQLLSFSKEGDRFVDDQTGSSWSITGHAIDGPLKGAQLRPLVHGDHFWFSWAAFRPDTVIYQG